MGLGKSTALSANDYAVKSRFELIHKYSNLQGKRILDIGCGNGVYSIEMAKYASSVIGIDINPDAIRQALSNKESQHVDNINFYCSDVGEFEHKEKFDIITMIEVLEHIPDDKEMLLYLRRFLKDDGELILFVPNKLYPFETHGMHVLGMNVQWKGSTPFLSWMPAWIRKGLVDEKIYTERSLIDLLQRSWFYATAIDYMFPPLDLINIPGIGYIRKLLCTLQKTPLKIFGMSIFCVARR